MNPEPLPDELKDLEARLRAMGHGYPSSATRSRVLACMNEELPGAQTSSVSRAGRMRFAASIAAALLIGSNLARVGASITSVIAASRPHSYDSNITERTLVELDPELSPSEVRRVLRLAHAAENLPRVPSPRASLPAESSHSR